MFSIFSKKRDSLNTNFLDKNFLLPKKSFSFFIKIALFIFLFSSCFFIFTNKINAEEPTPTLDITSPSTNPNNGAATSFGNNVEIIPNVEGAGSQGTVTGTQTGGFDSRQKPNKGLCFWDYYNKNELIKRTAMAFPVISGAVSMFVSQDWTIENCFAQIAYFFLFVFSWFVGFVGMFLNIVISYTLINMSENIRAIGAIDAGWRAVRDLVNIAFIFILLYIAIQTILGIDEHGTKHALVKLVIVALLINFSMFFTKVIIDTTNIVAYQFYNQIQPKEGGTQKSGFGGAVMSAFDLTSIYAADSVSGKEESRAQAFASQEHPFIVFFMGIIFMIIAISILVGGCAIFLKRYVVLIFLLIFAPIGFAGMILHKTEHLAGEWWEKLIAEAIAAPVFMIMMWLVFSIVRDSKFKESNSNPSSFIDSINQVQQGTVATLVNAGGINVVLNFIIVSYLFIMVLVACEKIGASGAKAAMSISSGVRGIFAGAAAGAGAWGFRNTVGRLAHTLVNKDDGKVGHSDTLARVANGGYKGNKAVGWAAKHLARGVIASGNSVGKGFSEGNVQDEVRRIQAEIEEAHGDPKKIAEIMARNSRAGVSSARKQAMDIIHHGMSVSQHANVTNNLEDMEKEANDIINSPAKIAKAKADLAAAQAVINNAASTVEEKEKAKKTKEDAEDVINNPNYTAQKIAEAKSSVEGIKAANARWYKDHGHGRLDPDVANQVEREKGKGGTFYNEKAQAFIDSGDYKGMQKFLMDEKRTEDQVLTMMKSFTQIHRDKLMKNEHMKGVFFGSIGAKFSGESLHANIAKDGGLDKAFKQADADVVFQQKKKADYYEILTGPKGAEARKSNNGKLKNDWIKEIKRDLIDIIPSDISAKEVGVEAIKKSIEKYELAVKEGIEEDINTSFNELLEAYKEERYGDHAASKKYISSSNGQRALRPSGEILKESNSNDSLVKDWVPGESKEKGVKIETVEKFGSDEGPKFKRTY